MTFGCGDIKFQKLIKYNRYIAHIKNLFMDNRKYLLTQKVSFDIFKCSKVLDGALKKSVKFEGISKSNFGVNSFENLFIVVADCFYRNIFSYTVSAVDPVLDRFLEL